MNIREWFSRAFVIISMIWVGYVFTVNSPGIFDTVKTLAAGLVVLWAVYWVGVFITNRFSSNN